MVTRDAFSDPSTPRVSLSSGTNLSLCSVQERRLYLLVDNAIPCSLTSISSHFEREKAGIHANPAFLFIIHSRKCPEALLPERFASSVAEGVGCVPVS